MVHGLVTICHTAGNGGYSQGGTYGRDATSSTRSEGTRPNAHR